MKIVTLEEFYALPQGIIFSKYEPINFSGLMVKGSTIYADGATKKDPFDFNYHELVGNVKAKSTEELDSILTFAEAEKTDFKLDFNTASRDGLFEKDQKFAIYSKYDVIELAAAIVDGRGYDGELDIMDIVKPSKN